MKLALYLPNFRTEVTVKELEDLTALAEDLDLDSVWTLDRIVVPESSDRGGELTYPFGMMEGLPNQLPVAARGTFLQGFPLIPWLAAKTTKVRIGMSIIDTPFRAPGVLAAELATIDHLCNGRLNVASAPAGCPRSSRPRARRTSSEAPQARPRDDRGHAGCLDQRHLRVPREFADFEPCGFGAKPVQKPHPPIFFSGLKDPKRSAARIAKYNLSGWIGIQDSPEDIKNWRSAIQRELDELDTKRSVDDLEVCSMLWTVITDQEVDQSDQGRVTNLMVGTAGQITDRLKAYNEAGLTMPFIWPPFADVPVAKTMDDLKRLQEEILPKVNA